ncbi:CoA-disulfide reductase [Falsibacillus albus]|uniref:CoA-disulfide reductase n=1 Tax=Falsibacillus albus TaxID=2478915 RepID=A0A3L7K4L9_9BACI|nr:CoA-disulfide reductase [Falsibacillus albus]RLQ97219.1 CoA-disulfide reductase [Falsibacillus albus]
MTKHAVIIGGVAGGATAAAQLRRLDSNIKITIVEKGNHISYSNCGIPYFIGGVVEKREKILKETSEFAQKYDCDIRTASEATKINRNEKKITYKHIPSGKIESLDYDILIMSPGASPRIPDISGLPSQNAFTVKSIHDMDTIIDYMENTSPKNAAIIGGGFIGMEMAENLTISGLDVSIIERSEHVMGIMDADLAEVIQDELKKKGVSLFVNEDVISIDSDGRTLRCKSGREIAADMIILALGITPNNQLAIDAGLEIGEATNGILVNEYMQTNDPSIYALGDVVETWDPIFQMPKQVPLAWPAHRQAFIIANHINGENIAYSGTFGTAIIKIFDLTAAMIGHNKTSLKKMNKPFNTTAIESTSHASYYPKPGHLMMKVHYGPESRQIFGAQAVGTDGVDKRIDVLATAMKGNLTVDQLQDLELAYAPPYSSPKDPVNILGYKAK